MATVNDKLAEASISHSIDLQHYSNGVVRRLIGLLNRVDSDLFAQITATLERLPASSFTAERLDKLLLSVRELNREVYLSIERELTPELRALTVYESGYQLQLFSATIPAPVVVQLLGSVDAEKAYSAAMSRPFQGRLLKEWMAGLEEGRAVRIRDAIRIGYVESQTTSQIVQRLRGTRAKGYSDGIIEIDRRNAESVVRTAISHMAGSTRDRFYEKNNDLIKAVKWVSTLDARTTVHICVPRDGKQYTNDTHKPIGHSLPWLGGAGRAHWGCRSSTVPVVKSFKELGINLPEFDEDGTRSSMDGQVSNDLTYGAWLQKQSAARQTEVLGKTRAKLMRDGGLTVDKFTNEKGRWLNLTELKQRDLAAFKRAGLQ